MTQRTYTHHYFSRFNCDAEGEIAYKNGSAWSVNVADDGSITEWRYKLNWRNRVAGHNPCTECERHILAALHQFHTTLNMTEKP